MKKPFRILRSQEALSAMADIYAYSKQRWGTAKAKAYAAAMDAALKQLSRNPFIGHQHPELPEEYRLYASSNHWIIYQTHDKNGELRIMAVIHQSMDLTARIDVIMHRRSMH